MKHTHLLPAILIPLLGQIPGCHFYIDATPHITVSSEPLDVTVTRVNHLRPMQSVPLLPEPPPPTAERIP